MFQILAISALDFWPSGTSNGYAYYHRVDQVNGGDMSDGTHTGGFSKKEKFWYD
jgi:hypothetical protein